MIKSGDYVQCHKMPILSQYQAIRGTVEWIDKKGFCSIAPDHVMFKSFNGWSKEDKVGTLLVKLENVNRFSINGNAPR